MQPARRPFFLRPATRWSDSPPKGRWHERASDNSPRRFPAPWRVERIPGVWLVLDISERRLAYFYGNDRSTGASDGKLTWTRPGRSLRRFLAARASDAGEVSAGIHAMASIRA